MATEVTVSGITASWTEDRTVHLSVTGRPVVDVGAGITGLAFDPAYDDSGTYELHGAMLNPTSAALQGLDGRGTSSGTAASNFSAALNIDLSTYTVTAGHSILKAKSSATPYAASGFDTLARSRLDNAMVLHFATSGQIPGTSFFAPPYAATEKPFHLVSEIDESVVLKNLSSAGMTNKPSIASAITRFEQLQIDHIYNPVGQAVRPKNQQDQYGGTLAKSVGDALLLLLLDDDITDRRTLLYHMVQYGIDLYYAMKNGETIWPINGGHNHGRKQLLVFTSLALQNTAMQNQIKEWSQ